MKHWMLVVAMAVIGGCAVEDTGLGEDDVKAEGALSVANFVTHPRVVEVRKEVQAIDAAIENGTLKKTRKDRLCAEGAQGETLREKYADASGKIRKLVLKWSFEDASSTTTLYYSASGKLRFAFDVNDVFSVEERGNFGVDVEALVHQRLYFNSAGECFWQANREVRAEDGAPLPDISKAPFTKPSTLSELPDDTEDNPGRAFDKPASCGT